MKKKTSLALDESVFVALKVEAALQRKTISEMLEMAVLAGLQKIHSRAGLVALNKSSSEEVPA